MLKSPHETVRLRTKTNNQKFCKTSAVSTLGVSTANKPRASESVNAKHTVCAMAWRRFPASRFRIEDHRHYGRSDGRTPGHHSEFATNGRAWICARTDNRQRKTRRGWIGDLTFITSGLESDVIRLPRPNHGANILHGFVYNEPQIVNTEFVDTTEARRRPHCYDYLAECVHRAALLQPHPSDGRCPIDMPPTQLPIRLRIWSVRVWPVREWWRQFSTWPCRRLRNSRR